MESFLTRFCSFLPTPNAPNRVGIRNSTDYSPFGVELDGRTVSVEGYRFGYQGSEKDNEFKGEGNSYTTEFRQLDPRLGRWLSMDPVIQPWQSSYCSMDNNPILLNDPLGDKIKYGKEDDVKGRDFRQMKRDIRQLKRHSDTFKAMFKYLDKREEVYTYTATNTTEGNARDEFSIKIGVNFSYNTPLNSPEKLRFAQLGMIAHETGHKFRELYGLDPERPVLDERKSLIEKNYSRMNKFYSDFVTYHQITEEGAMHIENIVRGELQRAHKYNKIEIHQYYAPSFTLEKEFTSKGFKYSAVLGEAYNLFQGGKYSKEYYKNKINIYEELGIVPNFKLP